MLGAETELDRQVLELIKDPLTHMVRNSADHGLEDTAGRKAAGKPETGVITLNAYHEGGHIIIRISDDGRGLNTDRIKAKIVANDLATEAEMESMSIQQIHQYIFNAGFSTAEKVTNVSGRGVGMDVVRTNIEKIGGTVLLVSTEGRGSTFTIKIPLTLAIVSALIVECSGQRFAIPQISVLELVRTSSNTETVVEMINKSPVLRLRNRLLPLVSLRTLLELDGDDTDDQEVAVLPAPKAGAEADASEKSAANQPAPTNLVHEELFIIVTQVGNFTFGIIVDRVFDTEEIVVKPVAPILRDISYYSGNTILGDGSVIMILDPNGIASATGQDSMGDNEATDEAAAAAVAGPEKSSMLIFRAGKAKRNAVPLALVARLEEIEMEKVELASGRRVVQYRGHLMPLVPFNQDHEWRDKGRQPILVFTEGERSMGLVVDEIVDIVEDHLKVELAQSEPWLVGSAIVGGQATDIIDAGHFLTQAFSDWFGNSGGEAVALAANKRVLLVDDSPFFRNLLSPLLSVAGYQVTTVENADAALRMRDEGSQFDVIVSDIEMPGMNGFEFAQEVRSDPRWRKVPMVALSSHASDQHFDRGRVAGFNDYVAKFDRDSLVSTIAQTLMAVPDATD